MPGRGLCDAWQGSWGQNQSLTWVNLSNNDLADRVAEELADCLHSNRVLTSLDVSGNPIGARGGAALVRLLRASPTLITLGHR